MESTCSGEQCPLWKKYRERCPNFIQTGWQEHDKAQPVLISDCAPKRTMLMMQTLYNRFMGVQQSNEEQRNESAKIMGVLGSIIGQLGGPFEETPIIDVTPETPLIEEKDAL